MEEELLRAWKTPSEEEKADNNDNNDNEDNDDDDEEDEEKSDNDDEVLILPAIFTDDDFTKKLDRFKIKKTYETV